MKSFLKITSYQAAAGGGTWLRYVSFKNKLASDEIITGTPEVTTDIDGVTISSIYINSSVLVDSARRTPVGQAVLFRVIATTAQIIDVTIMISFETDQNNRKTYKINQPIVITE